VPPNIPVVASTPVIPPVAAFPFVGRDGRLTAPAFQFLQQVWAALQGSGAIIDVTDLDQSGAFSGEIDAVRQDLSNVLADFAPATYAPADLASRLDSLEAQIAALRIDVQAQIQTAIADVMAWVVPTIAPAMVYVPSSYAPGILGVSQTILLHRFVLPAILAIDMGGSQFGATANATGSTVFNVDRAPAATPNVFTTIGTVTIAAGTITPTFATTSHLAVGFAVGDVLRVQGPVSPDATLADPYLALELIRQR